MNGLDAIARGIDATGVEVYEARFKLERGVPIDEWVGSAAITALREARDRGAVCIKLELAI